MFLPGAECDGESRCVGMFRSVIKAPARGMSSSHSDMLGREDLTSRLSAFTLSCDTGFVEIAALSRAYRDCLCGVVCSRRTDILRCTGILPHNGRGITFKEMSTTVRQTYNFAPSFCFFVPKFAADMLCRDYWDDKFDLSDLDVHNCIEHDGSLTRK